jgi:hypothetical protein
MGSVPLRPSLQCLLQRVERRSFLYEETELGLRTPCLFQQSIRKPKTFRRSQPIKDMKWQGETQSDDECSDDSHLRRIGNQTEKGEGEMPNTTNAPATEVANTKIT